MFKPFFLHLNPYEPGFKGSRYLRVRGATVYVTPVSPEGKHKACYVQVAVCSLKDQYCRRTGREEALKKPAVRLLIKDLPKFLDNAISEKLYGFNSEVRFHHVWKNFL